MKIAFSKFHGAGNDFILMDDRTSELSLTTAQIASLCDRRVGIGADGLILLRKPTSLTADFSMVYYNSDGLEGSMCGNGGRCITAFAHYRGMEKSQFIFDAIDGVHHSQICTQSADGYDITLKMIDVDHLEATEEGFFLNTGSPHLVVFVDQAKNASVDGMGKMLRHDPRFAPHGTNVNFVSHANGRLFVRTYERGVEAETLSCGTGITASAIATAKKLSLPLSSIPVDALGGSFTVSFEQTAEHFANIWLRGPVKHVFDGVVVC